MYLKYDLRAQRLIIIIQVKVFVKKYKTICLLKKKRKIKCIKKSSLRDNRIGNEVSCADNYRILGIINLSLAGIALPFYRFGYSFGKEFYRNYFYSSLKLENSSKNIYVSYVIRVRLF